MNDQMKLVKLTTEERLDLGKKAAKLGARLTALKNEFSEVKKDFNERIEGTQLSLLETLRSLEE
jgi:hypothetical protein